MQALLFIAGALNSSVTASVIIQSCRVSLLPAVTVSEIYL